jgi:ribosomal protein S8
VLLIHVEKLLAKLSAEGFLKNYAPGKKNKTKQQKLKQKLKQTNAKANKNNTLRQNKLDLYKSPGHSISIQHADKRTT